MHDVPPTPDEAVTLEPRQLGCFTCQENNELGGITSVSRGSAGLMLNSQASQGFGGVTYIHQPVAV